METNYRSPLFLPIWRAHGPCVNTSNFVACGLWRPHARVVAPYVYAVHSLSNNASGCQSFLIAIDEWLESNIAVDISQWFGGGLFLDQKILDVKSGRNSSQRHSLHLEVGESSYQKTNADKSEHLAHKDVLHSHQAVVVVCEWFLVINRCHYFSNRDEPTALKRYVMIAVVKCFYMKLSFQSYNLL